MRNGLLYFIGLFASVLLSWAGIVLGSNAQLGKLEPYFDKNEDKAYPQRRSGVAGRPGVALAGTAFGVTMIGTTMPTPLYPCRSATAPAARAQPDHRAPA